MDKRAKRLRTSLPDAGFPFEDAVWFRNLGATNNEKEAQTQLRRMWGNDSTLRIVQ